MPAFAGMPKKHTDLSDIWWTQPSLLPPGTADAMPEKGRRQPAKIGGLPV
jgi:hypothetical protein